MTIFSSPCVKNRFFLCKFNFFPIIEPFFSTFPFSFVKTEVFFAKKCVFCDFFICRGCKGQKKSQKTHFFVDFCAVGHLWGVFFDKKNHFFVKKWKKSGFFLAVFGGTDGMARKKSIFLTKFSFFLKKKVFVT